METLVKMMEVLVKIVVMMMAPGSAPAPPEARGRESPFFLFFLDLLPRWEKSFPSGPWLPWHGRGKSPSEIGSISLFMRSQILPLRPFFYIWRSVTPIGVNLPPDFSRKISFLAAKEEHQPPYGWPRRVPGTPRGVGMPPYLMATSGTISH